MSPTTVLPLEVVRPFSVFVNVGAKWCVGFTTLSFSLGPHGAWLLESPPTPCRRCPFQSTEAIHSWVFTLPQGFTGDHPSVASVRVTAPSRRCPSHGVSFPYSEHQLKGAVRSGLPSPGHCVFRVRTSLDALLPFEPSNHFWLGRSWDSPFRAFLLPSSRGSFRIARTLLTLPNPRAAR